MPRADTVRDRTSDRARLAQTSGTPPDIDAVRGPGWPAREPDRKPRKDARGWEQVLQETASIFTRAGLEVNETPTKTRVCGVSRLRTDDCEDDGAASGGTHLTAVHRRRRLIWRSPCAMAGHPRIGELRERKRRQMHDPAAVDQRGAGDSRTRQA
jgi:hypothetical protein